MWQSPYPYPDLPGCTTARWVQFPNTGFMMHFVNSWEYSGGAVTPEAMAVYIEELRDFRLGPGLGAGARAWARAWSCWCGLLCIGWVVWLGKALGKILYLGAC